jgi:membrane protease YdiL (CAAX protease family)
METKNSKVNWYYIALFYLIAFVISAPFNSGVFSKSFETLTQNYLISDWAFLPAGIGTFIAAGLAFFLYKNYNRTITFFGNNQLRNLAIALTPLVVFTIAGLPNEHQLNNNYYGFAFAAVALIYALSEEIFWRGFLQDALRPMGKTKSYLIIGIFWWAWHFRFNTTFDFTTFLIICIGSAFLLGKFAEETKSFLTSAGLHSLIILITADGMSSNSRITGGVISLIIWLSIGKWWKTKTDRPSKETLITD